MELGATGASDPVAISKIAARQLSAFIGDQKTRSDRGEILR
jgi:hypothetical protein